LASFHVGHILIGAMDETGQSENSSGSSGSFRHEALLYAGDDAFVERVTPWLREGLKTSASILVVVDTAKTQLLRSALGDQSHLVRYQDMREVGQNPARIIPTWADFVARAWPRATRCEA
jgi:hypothetical protein